MVGKANCAAYRQTTSSLLPGCTSCCLPLDSILCIRCPAPSIHIPHQHSTGTTPRPKTRGKQAYNTNFHRGCFVRIRFAHLHASTLTASVQYAPISLQMHTRHPTSSSKHNHNNPDMLRHHPTSNHPTMCVQLVADQAHLVGRLCQLQGRVFPAQYKQDEPDDAGNTLAPAGLTWTGGRLRSGSRGGTGITAPLRTERGAPPNAPRPDGAGVRGRRTYLSRGTW